LKPQINADERISAYCPLPTAHFFSLVAFVASAFIHTKNVTAVRHWTCKIRPPKVLRASVQLLHFLPFRPEFSPSYSLVNERSPRVEMR
jgi:hypothetical protein